MSLDQSIPCPDCGTAIHFDSYGLMQGQRYTCPNCQAEIALAQPGGSTLQDASAQLEKLKAQLEKDGGKP